ncbi:MAG TPA: methyltransferase domain-containing protein [Planctomycetia bacterium]|nr:methyltransferase domain-containing protein [Planctomycetia bacterium]
MMEKNPKGGAPAAPPYFDALLARLEAGDGPTTAAFGRHVHWGYWEKPESYDPTGPDAAREYGAAAERLCRMVCDAAAIADGKRILDVGCGFGGTIASLNERFRDLEIVGLNIDPRQLDRARRTIDAANGNRIRFLQGDACRMEFPADSFDVVLAVECIFHFPERAAFFAGASRALAPGGRLALSDFIPSESALPLLRERGVGKDEASQAAWGAIDVLCSLADYRELARGVGLELASAQNIGPETLPTYAFIRADMKRWADRTQGKTFDRAVARLESVCRERMLDYHVLGFTKPAA